MKLFYIDDSFFRDTLFLSEMRKRLFHLCRKQSVSIVLISCSNAEKLDIKEFINICTNLGIEVLCSPASFDYQGIKGILSHISLMLENYPPIQTFSGSVVCFHLDDLSYERIYLDLFPNHDIDFFKEDLSEEIEHILADFIKKHRNKRRFN